MKVTGFVKCILFLAALAIAKAQDLTSDDCCCTLTQGWWKNRCGDSVCNACDSCPWPSIPGWQGETEDAGVCDFISAYTEESCTCQGNALTAYRETAGQTNYWLQLFHQYATAVLNVHDCVDCENLIQPTLGEAAMLLASGCAGNDYGTAIPGDASPYTEALANFNEGNEGSGSPGHCDDGGSNDCCPTGPQPCPEERCDFCYNGAPNGRAYSGHVYDSTQGGEHVNNNKPRYCLRIDNYQGSGVKLFSCESHGASVTWSTAGDGSVVISGFVHLIDTNDDLYYIEAHYTGLECCTAPAGTSNYKNGDGLANDLCLSGTANCVVSITNPTTSVETKFDSESDGTGYSFIIGDGFRNDDQANFTSTGWFRNGEISAGAQDWIGVHQCIPDDCPPPVVCPEEQDCACTYTRGYWASPRFINPFEREDRDKGVVCFEEGEGLEEVFESKSYAKNVHDTCDYPNGLGSTQIDGCQPLTIAGLFQENAPQGLNRKVLNFAKQVFAADLNLENNICDCTPPDDLYCDAEAFSSLVEDGKSLVQEKCTANGKIDFVCTSAACHNALKDICVHRRDVLTKLPANTDCTNANPLDLNDALSYFNEGVIGPGHCGDRDDGARGCCSFCEQSPTKFVEDCPPGTAPLLQGNGVDAQGGGRRSPNAGWWDYANFVMLIVIIIILVAGGIYYMTRPGYMQSKASLADALKWT